MLTNKEKHMIRQLRKLTGIVLALLLIMMMTLVSCQAMLDLYML